MNVYRGPVPVAEVYGWTQDSTLLSADRLLHSPVGKSTMQSTSPLEVCLEVLESSEKYDKHFQVVMAQSGYFPPGIFEYRNRDSGWSVPWKDSWGAKGSSLIEWYFLGLGHNLPCLPTGQCPPDGACPQLAKQKALLGRTWDALRHHRVITWDNIDSPRERRAPL